MFIVVDVRCIDTKVIREISGYIGGGKVHIVWDPLEQPCPLLVYSISSAMDGAMRPEILRERMCRIPALGYPCTTTQRHHLRLKPAGCHDNQRSLVGKPKGFTHGFTRTSDTHPKLEQGQNGLLLLLVKVDTGCFDNNSCPVLGPWTRARGGWGHTLHTYMVPI